MKIKVLILFLLASVLSATGQVITDAAFAAAIYAQCPTCISEGKAGARLLPDAATLTELKVSNKDIGSIAGIEGFEVLQQLHCANNALQSLPKSLPKGLQLLDCSMNELTELPTLPAELIELSACSNALASLPLLPASLHFLRCHSNPLSELPELPTTLQADFGEQVIDQEVATQTGAVSMYLYPNPTRDVLFVRLDGVHQGALLVVLDMSGKVISTQTVGSDTTMELSVVDLPAGTYILKTGSATAQFVRL